MTKSASQEQREKMIAAYLDGASLKEASALFGYSPKACLNALKKAGVERRDTQFGSKRKPICLNKTPDKIRAEMVRDYLAGSTMAQCAKKFGYSAKACRNAVRAAGVKSRVGKYDDVRSQIISQYQSGCTAKEISAAIGCSETLCRLYLKAANIPIRPRIKKERLLKPPRIKKPCSLKPPRIKKEYLLKPPPTERVKKVRPAKKGRFRKYSLNEDFFASIDTEEKAYWLGFLAADGCITRNSVKISLKGADVNHLQRFAKSLNSTAIPFFTTHRTGKQQTTVQLNSKRLVGFLADAGITPRKSFTVTPWSGPDDLLRHYWRGCIDGDGWISSHGGVKVIMWSVGFCGNAYMVNGLAEYIKRVLGIGVVVSSKRPTCLRFSVTSRKAQLIVKHFYEDAEIALERKAEKAAALISQTAFGRGKI